MCERPPGCRAPNQGRFRLARHSSGRDLLRCCAGLRQLGGDRVEVAAAVGRSAPEQVRTPHPGSSRNARRASPRLARSRPATRVRVPAGWPSSPARRRSARACRARRSSSLALRGPDCPPTSSNLRAVGTLTLRARRPWPEGNGGDESGARSHRTRDSAACNSCDVCARPLIVLPILLDLPIPVSVAAFFLLVALVAPALGVLILLVARRLGRRRRRRSRHRRHCRRSLVALLASLALPLVLLGALT